MFEGSESSFLLNLSDVSLTVAAVTQVGPDDVFLGEAEDSQSASSHCGVYDDACVRHHLRTLIETNSAHRKKSGFNICRRQTWSSCFYVILLISSILLLARHQTSVFPKVAEYSFN